MEASIGFSLQTIRDYILFEGSKVEYHKLVKYFKRDLAHQDAKIKFKDFVNELAFVVQEGSTKYLLLRPEHVISENRVPVQSIQSTEVPVPLPRSHSVDERQSQSIFNCSEDVSPPQPPPRRKSLSATLSLSSNKNYKSDDKMRSMSEPNDEKESENKSATRRDQKLQEIHELSFSSAGRVKEHAQKLNRMASECELKPPIPALNETHKKTKGKENAVKDQKEDDTDSGSLQPLDPLRRRWMVTASSCNYNELLQLLREDSRLASFKDFTSTALHWAAKFGKSDVVKLIAGTHAVDPNSKSGGHTPLHLAAMFGHKDVVELLTNVYHANPNIRDYSGKLAQQYLKKNEEQRTLAAATKMNNDSSNDRQVSGTNKTSQGRALSEVGSSFIRIGSLNSKMRRTAAALSSITSWGSADSLSESNHPKYLVPNPRALLKKKRNKKALSTPPVPVAVTVVCTKDSDSENAH